MTENSTTDLPVDPEAEIEPLAARAPVAPESPAFSDFDIKPEIIEALAEVGIVKTFAIQEMTLPIALAGNDLIGQARTGMGKTLGFGVPLLHRIATDGSGTTASTAPPARWSWCPPASCACR